MTTYEEFTRVYLQTQDSIFGQAYCYLLPLYGTYGWYRLIYALTEAYIDEYGEGVPEAMRMPYRWKMYALSQLLEAVEKYQNSLEGGCQYA